ncbi:MULTISPECIES: hypothetical protein [unclassified Streptomyces]|nr:MULTISPECIES: hypothetical protein [unclassified Streptomyces]MCX5052478.1 hypothetical protein [Streptomyces sp. NBC_00474]MCX5063491.1 hypothetical protein [Streptomyces sp. NBC_00452]MCX5251645.1 hypothetical protein [Streptomyces sp. NBC_00201]MCX5294430.1 hypothetical protein [Streptomyces sp. NBC_00183]
MIDEVARLIVESTLTTQVISPAASALASSPFSTVLAPKASVA